MLKLFDRVHFVGIGGIGMCGIAEILLAKGFRISGSDRTLSEITDRLSSLGAIVYEGHKSENIKDVDVVVYSSAVSMENDEIKEAIRRNIPIIRRAEMLGELMRLKYGIGISGTHGKTTTTSLVGLVLQEAGIEPTIIVGGRLKALCGDTAKLGGGEFIVVEADEFDRSFLKLTPTIAAITSLEIEHLDTYKDLDDIKSAFIEFANKVPYYGFVVLCHDEKNLRDIIPFIKKRIITYGLSSESDVFAYDINHSENYTTFKVRYKGLEAGDLKLSIPGKHNVKNSLVAVAIAKELGISFETTRKALEKFSGVFRRFEIKANIKDIMVIDDYAHHPTEVSATLAGLRNGWNRRIVAVFQPHLFTRTRDFHLEFAEAFLNSDLFICTDIYPAREEPIEGITGELIIKDAIKLGHKNAVYLKDKKGIADELIKLVKSGDSVITLGAGDIWKSGEEFIEKLKVEVKVEIEYNE